MIFLLGTQHSIQVEWANPNQRLKEKFRRFRAYVRNAALVHAATAIAEEATLDRESSGTTIAEAVAEETKLRYVACEPTIAERELLGIPTAVEFPAGLPIDQWEAYRDAELVRHFPARENEWIKRLSSFLPGPILFVCGANHVQTFPLRLRDHHIACQIVSRNWWMDDDQENGALSLEDRPI